MEYDLNLQQDIKKANIDELRELKSEINKKLAELKDKEKLFGFQSFYSLDRASVKLSFKRQ